MTGKLYQVDMLSGLLQQSEMRQKTISQNIANVNTPGYRSMEVRFTDELDKIRSGAGAASSELVESEGLHVRQDGNNVDIDQQLAKLTKNSLQFETYSHLLAAKLSMLRSAITGQ